MTHKIDEVALEDAYKAHLDGGLEAAFLAYFARLEADELARNGNGWMNNQRNTEWSADTDRQLSAHTFPVTIIRGRPKP